VSTGAGGDPTKGDFDWVRIRLTVDANCGKARPAGESRACRRSAIFPFAVHHEGGGEG